MLRKLILFSLLIIATGTQTFSQDDPNNGTLQAPIISGLKGTVFTLHVNTLHPNGSYFMSYFQVRHTALRFTSPTSLFIEWEEIMGTTKLGDMGKTKYEALIKFADIASFEPVVSKFRPNANHSNNRKYAAIEVNGKAKNISLRTTTYTIENDVATKTGTDLRPVDQFFIPYGDLGECTECTPTIYMQRLLNHLETLRVSAKN